MSWISKDFIPYDQQASSHRRVQHENAFPQAEREMVAAGEVLKRARNLDSAIAGLMQKQQYLFNNFRAELEAAQRIPAMEQPAAAVLRRPVTVTP